MGEELGAVTRRRWLTAVLLTTVVSGCRPADDPAEPALALPCDDPKSTPLGVPMMDLPAYFATSGGRLRFTVSDMLTGTIVGDFTETDVILGETDSEPTPDPEAPYQPGIGTYEVTATLDEPGVLDVDAGSYWVVNTARGRIDIAACSDVTVSDVRPANPEPGGGGASGTPTPAPTSPPDDSGIPGTSPSAS